jgi:hypothetical protein
LNASFLPFCRSGKSRDHGPNRDLGQLSSYNPRAAHRAVLALESEVKSLCFLGTAAAVLVLATSAAAADKPTTTNSCFSTRNWGGWSAPDNGDILYLKVNSRDVYQLDLTPGSHIRQFPDRFLINRVRGSDWVCSPIDLDLTLSDHDGFREPIFITAMRKLTPDEIAAIPKKDRP